MEDSMQIATRDGSVITVDEEDYEYLSQFRWRLDKNGYARRNSKTHEGKPRRTILMHREIKKAPPGVLVDHANRDTKDNRKSNLRIATRSQNGANRPKTHNNTSGLKGAYFDNRAHKNKWYSLITSNGKRRFIGMFFTKEEAAAAYDTAALENYGEFALTNKQMMTNDEHSKTIP